MMIISCVSQHRKSNWGTHGADRFPNSWSPIYFFLLDLAGFEIFRLKQIYPVSYPILGSTLSRISFISLIFQEMLEMTLPTLPYTHQINSFTLIAGNKFLWKQLLKKGFQKLCPLWTYDGMVSHNRFIAEGLGSAFPQTDIDKENTFHSWFALLLWNVFLFRNNLINWKSCFSTPHVH